MIVTFRRTVAALAATLAITLGVSACGGGASVPTPTASSSSARSSASSAVAPTASISAPPPSPAASSSSNPQGAGIPAISGGPTGPAHSDPVAASSSAPVRVRIPAIGVDSALQPLGLNKDGTLETPSKWQVAGWYADGVRPGDNGPAVIAGHVDSVTGPAVFFDLRKLKPGDMVDVTRTDGSTVRFQVASTAEYPKRTFPTEAVYGPSPVPTLRLVTCTGDFNYAARSYVDNLVVTAYAV